LQNVIERAAVLCQGTVLELDKDLLPVSTSRHDLEPAEAPRRSHDTLPGLARLEDVERAHMLAVLERVGWLIEGPRGAARILGLHPIPCGAECRSWA
jgi:formate hydrogenlyase transcriptional activator